MKSYSNSKGYIEPTVYASGTRAIFVFPFPLITGSILRCKHGAIRIQQDLQARGHGRLHLSRTRRFGRLSPTPFLLGLAILFESAITHGVRGIAYRSMTIDGLSIIIRHMGLPRPWDLGYPIFPHTTDIYYGLDVVVVSTLSEEPRPVIRWCVNNGDASVCR